MAPESTDKMDKETVITDNSPPQGSKDHKKATRAKETGTGDQTCSHNDKIPRTDSLEEAPTKAKEEQTQTKDK